MKRHWPFLLIIFLLSVILLGALFHSGIYTAHDIWHNLARLTYYKKAISDGQFPPYWVGTLLNGWGYPLFFFSYHMPWLTALPFLGAGISITDTMKILFFISFLFSGTFMYLFASSFFKNRWAGLLTAFLYICAPYRFVITFVSAATGIAFVFIFLPLFLYGISLSVIKDRLSLPLLSIGFAGMILSHLTSLFVLTPVIVSFGLIVFLRTPKGKRKNFLIRITEGVVLGLALSGFYLLPALYYGKTVQGLPPLWKTGFISLKQLLYSRWGYGIINFSAVNESPFSFQIGIAQWITVLSGLIITLPPKILRRVKLDVLILLAGFVASIFFTLSYSSTVWSILSKTTNIDFPFRFIMPAFIIGSILGGYVFIALPKKFRLFLFLGLILTGLYTNRNHLKVNMYIEDNISSFIASETTTNSYDEYIPRWASKGVIGGEKTSILDNSSIRIKNLYQNTKFLSFDFISFEENYSSINYLSYPGLTTYIDGKKIQTAVDKAGRIKVLIPEGSHHLEVDFRGNLVTTVGKIISLGGMIFLFFLILKSKTSLPRLSLPHR
jgi:hypothetical protein